MLVRDVAVARAPSRAYAALVERTQALAWWRALRRPALVLLTLGVTGAIAAAGRVTVGLVASIMLLWSWVVALQILVGLVMAFAVRSRRVPVSAAIDLLFTGHLPWSLAICAMTGWAAADAPFLGKAAGCLMIAAFVWNAVVLNAFSRHVLGVAKSRAWIAVLGHQAMTWAVGLPFIASISGGWWRLVNP